MVAQRNFAIHEYHRLDGDLLWTTARENLPNLDQQLASVSERKETARKAAWTADTQAKTAKNAQGGGNPASERS
jgi:hypothetical protein